MTDIVGKIVTLSPCTCGLSDHTGPCQDAIRKHYEGRIAEAEKKGYSEGYESGYDAGFDDGANSTREPR